MSQGFLNFSGKRSLPLLWQAEASECGLACLAMVAGYHGYEVDLPTLRQRFSLSLKGMTLRTMTEIASGIGLGSRAIRCELEELQDLRAPAILHWGANHFVVLKAAAANKVTIHDPALGLLKLSMAAASEKFTGVALELTPNASFHPTRQRSPIKLGAVLTLGADVLRALVQTVILSFFIELLLLAAPFYLQLVIDQAILKSDAGLLQVLALAFTLLLLFRVAAQTLRGLSTQFISNVLAFDMKSRLFSHLVRLPLDWFQKRQIGDVQSRFGATRAIQTFVAEGALAAVIDGILGSLVLVLLFLYSTTLTIVVLVSISAFVLVRLATFQLTRRFAADTIVADAREQTRFLETLRAAQTIKSAAGENRRDGHYRNAVAASINAQIRSGNINIGYAGVEQLLNGLTDILVVYLGARAVMSADMTVGMLTAFLAYKAQFVARFDRFVEQTIAFKLLDLQLERLADVALSPREGHLDAGGYDAPVQGAIECRNLTFRYAFGEPFVLSNLSLQIAPGECVAIVGASGCGKTTLACLLTGLYVPSAGEVLIDGRSAHDWNKRSLRTQLSYVSQDDQLLAGSIAENIAFFDEQIDMDRVRECATIACIDDEIVAMPMAYESLVGDMGSSLSGGQKQRILIARALYRSPRILVLDEGTSHLDVANERAISASLAALPITRIIIAHRPETIASADRIICLDRGGATRQSLENIEAGASAGKRATEV